MTPGSVGEPSIFTTSKDRVGDSSRSAMYDGPVWIEELELLRYETHPPKTSLQASWATVVAKQVYSATSPR
eukprot:397017-Pleurochrysis_carterae.AAC.2